MRIVYFGNGIRGEICLEKLLSASKNIVGIVGHTNDSGIIQIAKNKHVPCMSPAKSDEDKFTQWIQQVNPELIILSGYNKILKRNILNIPPMGVINLHGGKLPEYRGTAPINWQLINGESKGGFSILFTDEGIDTGAVIRSCEFGIGINDSASDLVERSLKWFPDALLNVVNEFESKGNVESKKQDESKAVYYTRRYPEDGQIGWKYMKAREVHNLVRALVPPYPGAFTFLNGQKIIINETELLNEEIKGVPGRIPLKRKNGAITIAADKGLLIKSLIVDSYEISAKEFLNVGQKFN